MQVGDLVKRTFTNSLYANKHAVGVITNSHTCTYSVLWSDGGIYQHFGGELELINASR